MGLIHTYTGAGKAKSTSAMGLIFRAIGRNKKILLIQFLKGSETSDTSYGELIVGRKFSDNLKIYQSHDQYKVVLESNKTDDDKDRVMKTWDILQEELKNNYDMIVLDEILPTLCLRLLSKRKFFKFIQDFKNLPNRPELVLTGRIWVTDVYDRIKSISDYMSDVRAVKHPFNKHCPICKREFEYRSNFCPNCGRELISVPARAGVEY